MADVFECWFKLSESKLVCDLLGRHDDLGPRDLATIRRIIKRLRQGETKVLALQRTRRHELHMSRRRIRLGGT